MGAAELAKVQYRAPCESKWIASVRKSHFVQVPHFRGGEAGHRGKGVGVGGEHNSVPEAGG